MELVIPVPVTELNIKVGNRNGKMLKVGLVLGGAIASKKG